MNNITITMRLPALHRNRKMMSDKRTFSLATQVPIPQIPP
jgi:hypothetical protein